MRDRKQGIFYSVISYGFDFAMSHINKKKDNQAKNSICIKIISNSTCIKIIGEHFAQTYKVIHRNYSICL